MKLALRNGLPCILSDDGTVWAENLFTAIETKDNANMRIVIKPAGEWAVEETEKGQVAFCDNAKIYAEKLGDGICIYSEFTNQDDWMYLSDIVVLSFQYKNSIDTVFGNGLVCPNENPVNEMGSPAQTFRLVPGQRCTFGDFAACRDDKKNEFISGFLSYNKFFGSADVFADGTLSLHQFPDYHILHHGETTVSDKIYITPCDDIVTALPEFMDCVADEMFAARGRKRPDEFTVPAGYCTWYYHLQTVTGKRVLEAIENVKKYSDIIPLKYFQIDDGWYDVWGSWQPNEKFPEGMKFYADKIKEAGLIPGIWIAPFGASTRSDIFKNHPEYFIRDRDVEEGADGRHLNSGNGNLDFSVPEVCDYIAGVIHRLTYDWGFRYIKIDIITSCIGPYKHRNPDFSATVNYIKGMSVIREAAAEGTFILACTSPFGCAAGIADSARVSSDIHGHWIHVRDIFSQVLNRYYYHKKLFVNDADCLIIRNPENEDDECVFNCNRTDEENMTFIAAMAASGGALFTSDKLELLSDTQRRNISYLFPQNTEAGLPLDLMDSTVPGLIDMGQREKIRTFIFINWDEKTKDYSVNTGRKHAFDFRKGNYEGITDGTYTATVKPHECKIVFFTDTDCPAVIGTDSEIIPVIKQNYHDGKLDVTFVNKNEKLTVYAQSVKCDECTVEKAGENLFRISPVNGCLDVTLLVN